MGLRERHNIDIVGDGPTDMFMAHGYGCDQNVRSEIGLDHARPRFAP